MDMVDRETAKEIATVAAAELAVHVTKEMGEIRADFRELRASIPSIIGEQIRDCQRHQERRRRLSLGTFITIIGLVVANGLAAWAVFGG